MKMTEELNDRTGTGQTFHRTFAPDFHCCYFCKSSCLFYLRFNFDFYVSKVLHL